MTDPHPIPPVPSTVWECHAIAARAYGNKSRPGGDPLLHHAQRVAHAVADYGHAEEVVAILHDAIEDTPLELLAPEQHYYERTTEGLWALELRPLDGPPELVGYLNRFCGEGLDAVTRRPDTGPYAEYIERVARNYLARRVKIADLLDNLDPERAARLPARMEGIQIRYFRALKRLKTTSPVQLAQGDMVAEQRT